MRHMDIAQGRSSKDIARDRLKVVLASDRSDCPPDIIEQMKGDIVHVLSKYVEINPDGLDIKVLHDGMANALLASIPIKDTRLTDN